jgi:putative ABC transport system permease protein
VNTYNFHINLYDVAFQGAIFIGLTFAALLLFTKSINQAAKKFLGLALTVMVLWMIRMLGIDIRLGTYYPDWSRLPLQFSLALGPLIYFYVLKFTRPKHKFGWKEMLHFSPVLLEQGLLLFAIKESLKTGAATYDTLIYHQFSPILRLLAFCSVVTYLYISHQLINSFYKRMKFNGGDRYRNELQWLQRLLTGFGLLWLFWIPCTAVNYFGYHNQLSPAAYYPLYLLLALTMIWIGAAAFLRHEIELATELSPALKPSTSSELKQKGTWLKKVMEDKRLYQDPELSLSSMAEKLKIHTHELSRIINIVLNKNFSDFVNDFRVRDLVRKMQDPAYDHITLLGIAYESGFNSKSTFNRIFKQVTGKSPVEYKADLKKERPTYKLRRDVPIAPVVLRRATPPEWSHDKLNRNYMFRNYLKIAIRNFSRHRLFTLINVTGLSIGISAALVIFLVVRYDMSFDKFYPDSERIYRVVNDFNSSGEKNYNSGVVGPIPEAARAQLTGISQSAPFFMVDEFALNHTGVIIPNSGSGNALKFKYSTGMILADQRYFDMFPYKWLAGSKSALNRPFTVVLTEQKARKYFPSLTFEQMMGRVVIYGDTVKTTVAGIVQAHAQNTDFNFSDFISYSTEASVTSLKNNLDLTNWGGVTPSSQFFVKLQPNVSVPAVEKQLNQIFINNTSEEIHGKPGSRAMRLEKLSDIHFDAQYASYNERTASKTTLYGLQAIAAFLLLLASTNFINLSTAQSVQRAKEVGIRKTMGSSRRQLVLQFLSETFLITSLAVMLSVAITPFY